MYVSFVADSIYALNGRFRIYKSDINNGKIKCGVPSHLLNVRKSGTCKNKYFQVQLIEYVLVSEGEDADQLVWER